MATTTLATISGTLGASRGGTGQDFSGSTGFIHFNSGTASASSTIAVFAGGTGSTTLTGLLKGNGTGAIRSAIAGTDYLDSAITSLSGLTSASQTFATSSDTNITLSVVSSGSTHTLNPGWTSVLAVPRGGTGLSSLTANQLLVGTSDGTAWTQIATSSLGLLTTNVAEGSRLYFTDVRADARINATTSIGTLTDLPSILRSTTTNATTTNLSATNAALITLNVTGSGTSTFTGGLQANALHLNSLTASSTVAGGLILGGGLTLSTYNCSAQPNGGTLTTDSFGRVVCGADDSGAGSATVNAGTTNRLAYYSDTTVIDSANTLVIDTANNFFGIGTTTPGSALAVQGALNLISSGTSTMYTGLRLPFLSATSTATSSFTGGISAGGLASSNGITLTAGSFINTSAATSTWNNGINLTSGCFAMNGACIGGADLERAHTDSGNDSNTSVTTTATGTILSLSLTPATDTADVYILIQTLIVSASNTDGTLVFAIRKTDCTGTVIAETNIQVILASGTLAGSIQLSGTDIDPGAFEHTYAFCARAITQAHNVRMSSIDLLTVDTGADIAELYTTHDDTLAIGDVVVPDPMLSTGVQKADIPYDHRVLGIISAKPGLLVGSVPKEGVGALPLALAGRVSVKVSSHNGPIKAGDFLTSSDIPGVAMKATQAGPIIGQALTAWEEEEIGLVLAFVKNNYFAGEEDRQAEETVRISLERIGLSLTASEETIITASSSTSLGNVLTASVSSAMEYLTDKLAHNLSLAKEIFVQRIIAILGVFERVKTNDIEMKDAATGDLYCIRMHYGDFQKIKGSCDAATPPEDTVQSVVPTSFIILEDTTVGEHTVATTTVIVPIQDEISATTAAATSPVFLMPSPEEQTPQFDSVLSTPTESPFSSPLIPFKDASSDAAPSEDITPETPSEAPPQDISFQTPIPPLTSDNSDDENQEPPSSAVSVEELEAFTPLSTP